MKEIAKLETKVATLATIGYCGYYQLLRLLSVTVATTGYCGYYRSLWLLPVNAVIIGYCAY